MRRLLTILALSGLSLFGQARPTLVGPGQLGCPTVSGAPQILYQLPGVISAVPFIMCVALDMNSAAFHFVLDTSTIPPTLRIVGTSSGTNTPGPVFVDVEIPTGTVDGVNRTFTLRDVPNPASSLNLMRNGISYTAGVDYTLAGNVITYLPGVTAPQLGDVHKASYRK